MQPFVVLALPRSRTAWLSHFLSYGPWHCGHEELRHARSLEDVTSWLSQPFTGSCETAAAPFWRTLLKLRPDVKVVVIRRGIEGPIRSLKAIPDTHWDDAQLSAQMTKLDRKLDQIVKRVPGALEVRFEDLATEETCARVFEHCLGLPHDSARWQTLAPMNIQCSMPAILRYFQAHRPQLLKFAAQVKQHTLADMWRVRSVLPDDVTITPEPFSTFYGDCKRLLDHHCAAIGEAPDYHAHVDLDLHQRLYDEGALQCLVARSNGRPFGYLLTIISPSLDKPGERTGYHSSFYASPEFPGLGRMLQKAAKDALIERGVETLVERYGVRGDGPRLRRLAERAGATPHGELFLTRLKD